MTDLFAQGVELMFIGMGVVFSFLLLLVGMVTLMSRLVARYAPEHPALSARQVHATPPPAAAATVDARTLAVIRKAVRQHRTGDR